MSTEYYYGTEGNDYYIHNSSDDLVAYGGVGDDELFGFDGNDYFIGESGNDYLLGGFGADTFAFDSPYSGIDVIADFYWQEGDKIEVSQFGFGTSSTDGFFYNSNNGDLFFEGILFATIENVPIDFSTQSDIVLF